MLWLVAVAGVVALDPFALDPPVEAFGVSVQLLHGRVAATNETRVERRWNFDDGARRFVMQVESLGALPDEKLAARVGECVGPGWRTETLAAGIFASAPARVVPPVEGYAAVLVVHVAVPARSDVVRLRFLVDADGARDVATWRAHAQRIARTIALGSSIEPVVLPANPGLFLDELAPGWTIRALARDRFAFVRLAPLGVRTDHCDVTLGLAPSEVVDATTSFVDGRVLHRAVTWTVTPRGGRFATATYDGDRAAIACDVTTAGDVQTVHAMFATLWYADIRP